MKSRFVGGLPLVSRIEALLLLLYFTALLVRALLEREVRQTMAQEEIVYVEVDEREKR